MIFWHKTSLSDFRYNLRAYLRVVWKLRKAWAASRLARILRIFRFRKICIVIIVISFHFLPLIQLAWFWKWKNEAHKRRGWNKIWLETFWAGQKWGGKILVYLKNFKRLSRDRIDRIRQFLYRYSHVIFFRAKNHHF